MSNRKRHAKLDPVLKIRERELMVSKTDLGNTERELAQMESQLSHFQQTYMKSVDEINRLRSNGEDHGSLVAVESSIEFTRNKWAVCLHEIKKLERRKRLQQKIVLDLEFKVKAVTKLREKYEKGFQQKRAADEQGQIDLYSMSRRHFEEKGGGK